MPGRGSRVNLRIISDFFIFWVESWGWGLTIWGVRHDLVTGGSSHNGQYSHSNFTKLQECLEPGVYKPSRGPTILSCRKTLNIFYFYLFKIKCKYFPLNNKDLSFMDKLFSRTPNTTTQIILQINKLYWGWIKQKVHNKDSLKYQYFHPYDADIWRSEGHRLQLDISSN